MLHAAYLRLLRYRQRRQESLEALRLYVRLILRAIGYAGRDASSDDSGAAGEGARGPTLHSLHKRSTRHP